MTNQTKSNQRGEHIIKAPVVVTRRQDIGVKNNDAFLCNVIAPATVYYISIVNWNFQITV